MTYRRFRLPPAADPKFPTVADVASVADARGESADAAPELGRLPAGLPETPKSVAKRSKCSRHPRAAGIAKQPSAASALCYSCYTCYGSALRCRVSRVGSS